jgi:hypothetical protein
MSYLFNYCHIDNNNITNDCADPEYNRVYYNKDSQVYKLNFYGPPPSMSPGPLHPKTTKNPGDSLLNKDLPYANNDNNKYEAPIKKVIFKSIPKSTLTNSLNYTSNTLISNNSTLPYGHVGHQPKDNTVYTEKSGFSGLIK